jgi:hypothetical protein
MLLLLLLFSSFPATIDDMVDNASVSYSFFSSRLENYIVVCIDFGEPNVMIPVSFRNDTGIISNEHNDTGIILK